MTSESQQGLPDSPARRLVRVLGGSWAGDHGMARCPSHPDKTPSLSVADADGKVLVHCHACCSQQKVIAALRQRGLWPCTSFASNTSEEQIDSQAKGTSSKGSNTEIAQCIWNEAVEIEGTPVERYLRSRLITTRATESIRYAPSSYHLKSGLYLPAAIVRVQNSSGILTAIQRVYLRPDGLGKADVVGPKLSLGDMVDGAVRLGFSSEAVGLCEGWETGLSAFQMFGLPVWAALGATRMHRVWLPATVREVTIFADNDPPGHEAAERTAHLHEGSGRHVQIRLPSIGKDFNDELKAKGAV